MTLSYQIPASAEYAHSVYILLRLNCLRNSMIGQKLAHYEITDLLGKGGMGEVYRAHDTKLGRDVALKVLPIAMSGDPERLARFDREARTLATLQHPNIASIYGFEQDQKVRFLIMELAEGEDLSERIGRGPLPVDEALDLAVQLAESLEAAHAKGIIHRDLKPANIKISSEGQLKILDFGLARAYTGEPGPETDLENSPTITAAMTQAGTILGTAAYMSPEQARGKHVDRRTDIWAFGCVLYEMLTGQRPFQGDDTTEVIAHLVTQEPDFERLPANTPASIRDLIARCLRKEVPMRLPDIAAARIAIQESFDEAPANAAAQSIPAKRSPLLIPIIALVATALGLLIGFRVGNNVNSTPPTTTPTHFDLDLDPPAVGTDMAISPDASAIVYSGRIDGRNRLFLRELSGFESRPILESDHGDTPFFAPDGQSVGFLSAGRLKTVSLQGGLAASICAVPGYVTGIFWTPDDEILFSTEMLQVPHRVSADGGESTPLTIAGYGYQLGSGYSLFATAIDGGGEPELLLEESDELPSIVPTSIHPDGRILFYAVHPETSRDIWILDKAEGATPVLQTNANERAGSLSPDGKLFAYISDEDGADQMFLREFPDLGRKWPVGDEGGRSPVWSRDGSELFFQMGEALYVVAIEREGRLRVGEPVEIFRSERLWREEWGNRAFDIGPDGRLLVSLADPDRLKARVILNWGTAR